jgi:hypothetical protein
MDTDIVHLKDEENNYIKNYDTIDLQELEEYILSLENDINILNHITKLLEDTTNKVAYYEELYNIFLHQNYDEITVKNNKYNIISILNDIEEYIIDSTNTFQKYKNNTYPIYVRIIQVLYDSHQKDINTLTGLYDKFSELYNSMNTRRLYLLISVISCLIIYVLYVLYIIGNTNIFDSHKEL